MLNEVPKICEKWHLLMLTTSANKNNNKRSDGSILQIFRRISTFKTWNNVKRACTFHLILFGILSILILSIKNRGWVFFLLNGQNPLSITKVICWYSLTLPCLSFYFPAPYHKPYSTVTSKRRRPSHSGLSKMEDLPKQEDKKDPYQKSIESEAVSLWRN